MTRRIDPKLKSSVERFIHERFPDTILDDIVIEESFDADGDEIVKVMVLLKERPEISSVTGLTQKLWRELSRKNFGFPIVSFRTSEENTRLSAAA